METQMTWIAKAILRKKNKAKISHSLTSYYTAQVRQPTEHSTGTETDTPATNRWDTGQDQQRAPPCWLSSHSELRMCGRAAQEGQRWIDSILYPLPCLPLAPIASLLPAPSCVPSFPLLSVFLSITSPHTRPNLSSSPQGTSSLVTEC